MNTYEIGLNAGKIWNLIDKQGDHSVKELQTELKLTDKDINMALGWLSKEGKIFHFESHGEWRICLSE
jgi:hypothetical protein